MSAPAVVLSADPVWDRVREEAGAVVRREPALAGMMHGSVIDQPSLEHAVAERIAARLTRWAAFRRSARRSVGIWWLC